MYRRGIGHYTNHPGFHIASWLIGVGSGFFLTRLHILQPEQVLLGSILLPLAGLGLMAIRNII